MCHWNSYILFFYCWLIVIIVWQHNCGHGIRHFYIIYSPYFLSSSFLQLFSLELMLCTCYSIVLAASVWLQLQARLYNMQSLLLIRFWIIPFMLRTLPWCMCVSFTSISQNIVEKYSNAKKYSLEFSIGRVLAEAGWVRQSVAEAASIMMLVSFLTNPLLFKLNSSKGRCTWLLQHALDDALTPCLTFI